MSFVYVMESNYGTKVGSSTDPERRRTEIKSKSGIEVQLVATFELTDEDEAYSIEFYSHNALDEYRLFGDWFSCDSDYARKIIREVISGRRDKEPTGTVRAIIPTLSSNELIKLIAVNDGRVKFHTARRFVYPYTVGIAARTLRAQELIEPWHDVLVLTQLGWTKYKDMK